MRNVQKPNGAPGCAPNEGHQERKDPRNTNQARENDET